MIDLIIYDKIERKNIIERARSKKLNPHDSLVHSLNVMDFMASFNKGVNKADDGLEWIILELKRHDRK